jgi:hypothetical protein
MPPLFNKAVNSDVMEELLIAWTHSVFLMKKHPDDAVVFFLPFQTLGIHSTMQV